ncbi:MAG: winged helix-turn-helix transcriptional regulator [Candidatus Thermoplasmatota archaeon]|nr:winged helix-turn-helix transcriptional regulator [Candidatus Thermoplasmatota archaeon]
MNRLEIAKQVRQKILYFIKRNPGTHFSEILRRLGLSSGRLTYHIMKLEEAGKIFAQYEKYWKRFYPISMKDEMIPKSLTPKEEKIFKLIKRRPGSTYMDLVKQWGTTRQSIYYHFKKLTKMGLIRTESVKGEHHFYAEGNPDE